MRHIASLLVLSSAILLALGVTQPLLTFERLYFLKQQPSLVEIIVSLARDGDVLLALIVGLISVAFPLIKLAVLQLVISVGPSDDGLVRRVLSYLAKWSMMDVVLVAIMIFATKTTGFASALTQSGLWFYTLSAITGAVAASLPIKPQCDSTTHSDRAKSGQ